MRAEEKRDAILDKAEEQAASLSVFCTYLTGEASPFTSFQTGYSLPHRLMIMEGGRRRAERMWLPEAWKFTVNPLP
jgi:hypothetical protein